MNIVDEINKIFEITETYKAPARLLEILKDENASINIMKKMLKLFNYDISYDWFHEYFQSEHADRKNKKQDFTPHKLAYLVHSLHDKTEGIIYEIACGTGGIIIQHYNKVMEKYSVFSINPTERIYICEELSERTIPFLLFNLAIRGVNAVVIECDSLSRLTKHFYHVFNVNNDCMMFSKVKEIDKKLAKETLEQFTNLKFNYSDEE